MKAGQLLHETTSLCRDCKRAIPARIVVGEDGGAWMQKACLLHGEQSVRLAPDAEWYERTRSIKPIDHPPRVSKPVSLGCPFDCGPCTAHQQTVRLPVVTITSACNLDCPICYVHNKNEGAFHMSPDEFRSVMKHLVANHGGTLDIVNLTGGEPVLHPELLTLLRIAHENGVHRVTVCSNGLKLAKDENLVRELAAMNVRIAMSFDTFDNDTDVAMQGAKMLDTKLRALDLLEKHNVDVTLIPVMTRGYNDHEIGKIIQLGLERSNVRHIEVHLMTYTGQGGIAFPRSGRITLPEVVDRIVETTDGLFKASDFVPSPNAHPLCYQIAYVLMDPAGGRPIPFTRFLSREQLYACLSERLYLEPSRALESAMHEAIDRLWASDESDDERTLGILRTLVEELFPKDGKTHNTLRASERASKAIYVHSHMDEENFDVERLAQCCDSNCYADGSTIPVCAYNVLYREKEERFMEKPRTWSSKDGGHVLPLATASSGARKLPIVV